MYTNEFYIDQYMYFLKCGISIFTIYSFENESLDENWKQSNSYLFYFQNSST